MYRGERPWIDLTRPMNAGMEIYSTGAYADPPFRAEPWCDLSEAGFAVWHLQMGTQTGTHIDAPSHFVQGAATLETLAPDDLVGPYFHVDVETLSETNSRQVLAGYSSETILFLAASGGPEISQATANALLAIPCRVWVMAGSIRVRHPDKLFLHRAVAEAGKFLIEDLVEDAARIAPVPGEIIAMPLRLEGVSGSPIRIIVRPPSARG